MIIGSVAAFIALSGGGGGIPGVTNKFESSSWSGDNSNRTINMSIITEGCDVVHIKDKDRGNRHVVYNSIQGADKFLITNEIDAENSSLTDMLTALAATSFNLGVDTTALNVNDAPGVYISWTSSLPEDDPTNSDGSITANIKHNNHEALIIFTGNNTAGATVGHALPEAPEWVEAKGIGATGNWRVYTSALGATKSLLLNTNGAELTSVADWNSTAPSASVITLGTAATETNQASTMMIRAYTSIPGECDIGSFTVSGGSISGGNIDVGFDIGLLDVKRTDATGDWYRMTKGNSNALAQNSTDDEATVGANPCGFGSNTISNVSLPDGDYAYKAVVEPA